MVDPKWTRSCFSCLSVQFRWLPWDAMPTASQHGDTGHRLSMSQDLGVPENRNHLQHIQAARGEVLIASDATGPRRTAA